MKIDVPAGHLIGMRVPKGGSDCAKCKYVSEDGKKCGQPNFVKWNNGPLLPEPANEYCCDFFQAENTKRSLGDLQRRQTSKKS